jgi:hypothetical protein
MNLPGDGSRDEEGLARDEEANATTCGKSDT